MKRRKRDLDIFVCGGTQHVEQLLRLLGRMYRLGTVHLASCFLSDSDLGQLEGLYDVLHEPRHSADGYRNFELFCIRDVNRLASAPYFVKLDADVELERDWIDYVEDCVAAHPDGVLMGPWRGKVDITLEITGPLARRLLSREIRVRQGHKVIGGFYLGKTAFFRRHRDFMDTVHELLWCFEGGVRSRPGPDPRRWPSAIGAGALRVIGDTEKFRTHGNEDTLRNLVVHALGAGGRLHVIDSGGRVRLERRTVLA